MGACKPLVREKFGELEVSVGSDDATDSLITDEGISGFESTP
jgi:hypothetical protein